MEVVLELFHVWSFDATRGGGFTGEGQHTVIITDASFDVAQDPVQNRESPIGYITPKLLDFLKSLILFFTVT